jgi:hypothetical protein
MAASDPERKMGPTMLTLLVIGITLLGLVFAIAAISTELAGHRSLKPSSTNRHGSPRSAPQPRDAPTHPVATTPDSVNSTAPEVETESQRLPEQCATNLVIGIQDVTGVTFSRDALRIELTRIANLHAVATRIPNITVYEKISDNLRHQCLILLALLQKTTPSPLDAGVSQDVTALLDSQQLRDPPYYTTTIAAYSAQLAALASTVAELYPAPSSRIPERTNSQLGSVPHLGALERTRDSAFVTACALHRLGLSKFTPSTPSEAARWSELEADLTSDLNRRTHVIRHMERAHQLICEILLACLTTATAQPDTRGDAEAIYASCARLTDTDGSADPYQRLAARTEAEVQLMLLLANTL